MGLTYFYITFFIFFAISISYPQEFSLEQHGTSIICIMRHDTIWIGADSKVVNNKGVSTVNCKITQANDFVFVYSGISQFTDIYVDSIFKRCYGVGRNIHKTMELFDKEMLHTMFEIGGKAIMYKLEGIDSIGGIATLFATYENGMAKFFSREYYVIIGKKQDGTVFITSDFDSASVTSKMRPLNYYLAGHYEAIASIAITKMFGNIPAAINELIGMQIKATPNYVGYPINIICISKDGINWVQENSPCE